MMSKPSCTKSLVWVVSVFVLLCLALSVFSSAIDTKGIIIEPKTIELNTYAGSQTDTYINLKNNLNESVLVSIDGLSENLTRYVTVDNTFLRVDSQKEDKILLKIYAYKENTAESI